MERDTVALVQQINELEVIFRSAGDTHWADWLAGDAGRISAGDLSGIDHLLSAYGGMGSLSDAVITIIDSLPLDDVEAVRVNEKVNFLRSSIYELARRILTEQRE